MEYEVEGSRTRRRPKRTWKEVVREDCQARKLNKEDAVDRTFRRRQEVTTAIWLNESITGNFPRGFILRRPRCRLRASDVTVELFIESQRPTPSAGMHAVLNENRRFDGLCEKLAFKRMVIKTK